MNVHAGCRSAPAHTARQHTQQRKCRFRFRYKNLSYSATPRMVCTAAGGSSAAAAPGA